MNFEDNYPEADYDIFDWEDKIIAKAQKLGEIKCDSCQKLPHQPRMTTCCKKYVCFECWDKERNPVWRNPENYNLFDHFSCVFGCGAGWITKGQNLHVFLTNISIKSKISDEPVKLDNLEILKAKIREARKLLDVSFILFFL